MCIQSSIQDFIYMLRFEYFYVIYRSILIDILLQIFVKWVHFYFFVVSFTFKVFVMSVGFSSHTQSNKNLSYIKLLF